MCAPIFVVTPQPPRAAPAVWLLLLAAFTVADVPGLRFVRHPEPAITLPGTEVTFECALNVSADRVEWKHQGNPIVAASGNRSNGRLIIQVSNEPVEYALQTGTYQCVAWFGASAMASLPGDLQVARLQGVAEGPSSQLQRFQVAPGNVVALHCPPPSSTPQAQVHFRRNGHPITGFVSRWGTLLLSNVSRADSGLYSCSASNPITGTSLTLRQTVELSVETASSPKAPYFLAPRITNYTVTAGSDVNLECATVGWPVPVNSWIKYGGSLPKDRTTYLPGALSLSSVTTSDEGTYVCESSNGIGPPVSCVIMLYVQEAPSIVKEPTISTIEEGGDVHMECTVKGNPPPTIKWLQNGESVDKDNHITTNGVKLHIKQVEKRHAGIFQCFATNTAGSAFGLAMLQVLPKPITSRPSYEEENENEEVDYEPPPKRRQRLGKPKPRKAILIPPSKPNITRLSDESVMVRWSVPSDEGLPIQFFKVQYQDLTMGGVQWMTIDDDIPPHIRSYEVDSLKTDHSYKFRIAAVYLNNDNKLGPNSRKFHLQKEPATKRPLFPPTLSHAAAVSPSAIEIEWQYTEVPSTPIEGFFIYYRSTTMAGDYTKATVLGENTRSYLITHLLPDNSYDIKMQSFNTAGASDFSAIRSHRTQYVPTTPEPGSGGSRSPSSTGNGIVGLNVPVSTEGSSNQLGLVIGIVLGGLVLLLLLLSVGVYICRQTGGRTAAAEHDQAKEVQAYGLAAVGKPLTNGGGNHLHLHHRHHPRVHITANPLAATTDHYKSEGELEVSGQNNNCAALLESANHRRRRTSRDDDDDELSEEDETPPPPSVHRGHCENYV